MNLSFWYTPQMPRTAVASSLSRRSYLCAVAGGGAESQAFPKAVDTQKDILTAKKGARYRRIGAGMKASPTSKTTA
jgi:hypothetical protein